MGKHDHSHDRQVANNEVSTTDGVNLVRRVFHDMFGTPLTEPGVPAKDQTNFEGHQLNQMIDLVEHGTPHHMTTAGDALWSARDAINDAAEELHGHITNVDWEGEAGRAFQKWGAGLVTNTRALAKYAGDAGTQITVAGSGLASVQKSMPPRDTRTDPKTVSELPPHKRVKGDADYDAAVQVEGHRQEAINQMTRLASFYSVASGNLASSEPPTFQTMPDVGVPKPLPDSGFRRTPSETSGSEVGSDGSHGITGNHSVVHTSGKGGDPIGLDEHNTIEQLPERRSVQLDTVGPPPLTPDPPTPTTPPVPTPQSSQNQSSPLFPHSGPQPGPTNFPKAFGKVNASEFGRTAQSQVKGGAREPLIGNKNVTGNGRTANGMPRGPLGQTRATGRTPNAGRMPMGRGGVAGGKPRAAGQIKSSQAGAVRKGGVVGGRPNAADPMKGTSSRVPRGTVIGGQQGGVNRTQGSSGKIAQRGVIGAQKPPENKPQQPTRRAPGAPEGVLGAPKERVTGPKGQRAGFTSGGSGLVRGQNQGRRTQHGTEHQDGTEHQHRPPHAPPAND
jgi:uncharacterized protein YukE